MSGNTSRDSIISENFIVTIKKDAEELVDIYVLYREPKYLEDEESETTLIEKTVKIPHDSQSPYHLVSIFENLGKEEFKLDERFSKRMNLESLFHWNNLLPEQRKKLMQDLFLDFIQKGLYGRSKEKTKLILLFDLTPLGYGISLIQTTITGKEIKLKKNRKRRNITI